MSANTIVAFSDVRAILAAARNEVAELSKKNSSPGDESRYFVAVRDDAILQLLFESGIRVGELVRLDVTDLDLDAATLSISGRTTGKRTIQIESESLRASLRQYSALRQMRELDTPALFVGRSGTRLTIYSIETIFKKYVRLAHLRTPTGALRHTIGASAMASADPTKIQDILRAAGLGSRASHRTTVANAHHVIPSVNGGWTVIKEGATRASKQFSTKEAAESWARSQSIRDGSELVIHRRDGTIATKSVVGALSSGNDS